MKTLREKKKEKTSLTYSYNRFSDAKSFVQSLNNYVKIDKENTLFEIVNSTFQLGCNRCFQPMLIFILYHERNRDSGKIDMEKKSEIGGLIRPREHPVLCPAFV